LIEKKKKVHPNSGRVKWPAGMPIDMPPVPVKRGTASLSLLDFAHAQHQRRLAETPSPFFSPSDD